MTETVDQGPGETPPPAEPKRKDENETPTGAEPKRKDENETPTGAEPKRKREIMGPTGLIVMVAVIFLITAVAIIVQARANNGTRYHGTIDIGAPIRNDAVRVVFHITNTGTKAGRPDVCEATLLDLRGARAGTAGVYLREPIQPGETFDVQAVGTVAREPVNGVVECRAMSPG